MMLLSDNEILGHMDSDELSIEPWNPRLLQPASIDLRLGNKFLVFNNHFYTHIDPSVTQPGMTSEIIVIGKPFILHPGEFVLASTLEAIRMGTSIAGMIGGVSSLGRIGLLIHSTAGFIDPGFKGNVTLELSNVSRLPIMLWPNMRIGQLCVLKLSSRARNSYGNKELGSHYQDQSGPTASRSWDGFWHNDLDGT